MRPQDGPADAAGAQPPLLASAREKGARALGAVQNASRQLALVQRLLARLTSAPNEAVAYDAARQIAQLRLDDSLPPGTVQLTTEVIDQVSADFKRYLMEYGARFRTACEQLGYAVEGHYPDFTVNHTVHVTVDDEARRAKVQRKVLRGDISVEAVVAALQQEMERLTGGPFDPESFLVQLCDAYRASTAAQPTSLRQNGYVGVLDVYQRLKQRVERRGGQAEKGRTDYPLDRFAADLSRLLQLGALRTPDGWVLELAPARGKGKVFLFDPRVGRARYLGLIAFRRE